MFYSHQLLARKAPLDQIWMEATMHAKINRRKLDKLNIINICEEILNPSVPRALRLSGILMGGVFIVYERKVKLLYEDVTRLLVEMNEAWKVKSVADPTVLPKGKSQAKYEAVTLPENQEAELGEIEQSLHCSNSNTIMGFQQTAYFAMRLDNVDEPFVSHNPKEQDLPQNHHQADPANITLFEHFDSYQADTSAFNRFERFDIEGDEDEAQGNFAPQEHTEIPSTLIPSPPLREVPQQLIAEPGGVFISNPKKPLIVAPACVLGEEWSGMQSDTKLKIGSGSRSGRKRDSDDKEEKLRQKKIKDEQPIKHTSLPLIEVDEFSNFLKDHLGEKMLVLKVEDQYAFQIYVPKTNDSKRLRASVDIKGYLILDNVGTWLLLCHRKEQKFCHYDISSGSKRDLPQIPEKIRFRGNTKGTFEPDGKTILMMHDCFNRTVCVLVFTPDERGGSWRQLTFPLKSTDPVEPTDEIEGLLLNHFLVWAITSANSVFCISVDGPGAWVCDCHNPTKGLGPITDACLVKDKSNGQVSFLYIGICEGKNCCYIRLCPNEKTVRYDMVDQREILISHYKGILGKELEDEESVRIYAAKRCSSSYPNVEVTLFSGVNANSQVIKYCNNTHRVCADCQCTRAWIIG